MTSTLNDKVDALIEKGITHFIYNGEAGFSTLAASTIIAKKEQDANLRLIFTLPYVGQEKDWPESHQEQHRQLLDKADNVIIFSKTYTPGCIDECYQYMADNAAHCISGF